VDVRYRDASLERLRKGSGDGGYPAGVAKAFRKRMQAVEAAPDERLLRTWKSLHFEKYGDQYSIRLNDQWRLLLDFEGEAPNKVFVIVAITDYH
jgi:proteic killer suppression protein